MTFTDFKNSLFGKEIRICRNMLSDIKNEKFYDKAKTLIETEHERLIEMNSIEKVLYSSGNEYIAGVDEAGRGPLAGPIVAACVVFPKEIYLFGLNDSKKLNENKREALYKAIMDNCISSGIDIISHEEIDDLGISAADNKAMRNAVNKLSLIPDHILSDAFKIKGLDCNQTPVIKGDTLALSIAAASILAKVTRDRIMCEHDKEYPEYSFSQNKGYGTEQHIYAINKYGICPIHRKTFVRHFVRL